MSDPSQNPKTLPIDWPKFYAAVESLSVPMPTYAPGEPADLGDLRRLLCKVQDNRDRGNRLLNSILQRLAEAKRNRDIAKTTLRVERVTYASDPQILALRSAAERRQSIDELGVPLVTKIGFLESRIAELGIARECVENALRSLETAKETLNAIHRQTLVEIERLGGNV